MNKEKYITLLQNCLNKIRNKELREFGVWLLDKIPEYFWEVPASSTGKYHPKFSLGDGGLVRHTVAAVNWYENLMRPYEMQPEDNGIFALIFHDCIKCGIVKSTYTVTEHPELAAKFISEQYQEYIKEIDVNLEEDIKIICTCVETHMGIWGKTKPSTKLEKFVHLADYCAAQKIHDSFASI